MRALVVVDYQTDFVNGTLGSQDAVIIGDAVCDRISDHLASGDDVFFTRDTHGPDYLDSREGRMLPVPHCIHGTPGWEIHGRVGELSGDPRCRIFDKPTFGCAELMDALRGYDEIELCGVATNICVMANAVIARTANPEADVVVRRECVASYDRRLGEEALDVMVSLQRAVGEGGDVIAEGRDIGTVVFPSADVKVFLSASPEARARRRAVQRQGGNLATGDSVAVDEASEQEILADLVRRDTYDSSRETSPLRPAEDAVRIDSSELSFEEVIGAILALSPDLGARAEGDAS